jgi:hypothetical protein
MQETKNSDAAINEIIELLTGAELKYSQAMAVLYETNRQIQELCLSKTGGEQQ